MNRSATKDELRQLERDVLGAPAVPPGRIAGWANTARRRLLGLHRRSAPPPLQVLEALFASFDAHALRVLVELGIPDALGEHTTIAELAGRIDCDPTKLERLLRFAAGRGFVAFDRKGRVGPTGVTAALQSDAPAPWHGWVRFATSEWFDAAWRRLGPSLRPDAGHSFELAHGTDFFDYTTAVDPEAGATFDLAMASGATLQAIALAHTLEWDETRSVCDVGGGDGTALSTLQKYFPGLRATLFDLPTVVERCEFAASDEGPARSVVGGSFFEEIPAGHDRYLLLAIVHDWDDERVVAILRNVRDAMGTDGEAVVVETIASEAPRHDFASSSDLLMFVLASGRERTEDDYHRLYERARLVIRRQQLLPTGATAFTLRPRPTG